MWHNGNKTKDSVRIAKSSTVSYYVIEEAQINDLFTEHNYLKALQISLFLFFWGKTCLFGQ